MDTGLSQEVLKEFAKVIVKESEVKKDSFLYGMTKKNGNNIYVKFDGSDLYTPVSSAVDVDDGNRVLVMIKNHSGTILSNITSPAARIDTVNDLNAKVDEQGNIITAYGNEIYAIGNKIALLDNTITAQDNEIYAINNKLGLVDNTITSQGNEIYAINNKLGLVDNTITAQGNEIYAINNKLGLVDNTITAQGNEIYAINNKLGLVDNTITSQGNEIYAIGNKIAIVDSSFQIKDGVVTGIKGVDTEWITTKTLESVIIKTETIEGDYASFKSLVTDEFVAQNGIIDNLTGQFSNFETSVSQELITAKGWMLEGAIGDAQISSVSANKLTAGTIDTALVTIAGTDGRLQIADNTIQISDSDHVRVQVGKDASGDYTLAVWDANGNLIWDALGATEHTIQRQIIRDRMVADDAAIQALKIDFQSFDTALTEQGVTISGTVVQVGSKTLNVALSEQTQAISDNYVSLMGYADTVKSEAISTAANDATAKANSALANAKSYADAAVNGLEIGGRNLLRYTKEISGHTDYISYASKTTTDVDSEGFTVLTIPADGNYGSANFYFTDIPIPEIEGKEVTISAWVKSSGLKTFSGGFQIATGVFTSGNTRRRYLSLGNFNGSAYNTADYVDNEWVRLICKATLPLVSSMVVTESTEDYVKYGIQFFVNNNNSAYPLQIKKVKVEFGNKVTDWTPAPEDIEQELGIANATIATHTETLSSHETRIAANENAIKLKVSTQDFTSYQATVTGQISEVQLAIDAKKSYVYLTSNYSQSISVLKSWAEDGKDAGNWTVTSTAGVKVGDTVAIRCVNTTSGAYLYIIVVVTSVVSGTVLKGISHGYIDPAVEDTVKTYTDAKITTVNESLSTTNQEISVMKGQIALKVEQTDIDSAVQSIEVGGRNLVANTGPASVTGWTASSGWTVSLVDCTTAPYGKAIRATNGTATSGGVYKVPIAKAKMVNGEKYTISAWIRASKSCTLNFKNEMMGANTISVTTAWQKYMFTSTIDTGATYYANVFYVTSGIANGMWIEIHSLKLEKGTKATDWTPAPEDVDSAITTVDNKFASYSTTTQMTAAINTAKDSITSMVSSTYATQAQFSSVEGSVSTLTTRVESAESKLTKDSLVTTIGSYYATQTYVDGLEYDSRNLAIGTSAEWQSKAITDITNATAVVFTLTGMNDKGLQEGDILQIGVDLKFSSDFAATGTGTKASYLQGDCNQGGTWTNISMTGGNQQANIEKIIASSSKTGHITTYVKVTKAMIDGTYSGKWIFNIRFNYYKGTVYWRSQIVNKGSKPQMWSPAPEDTLTYMASVETIATQTSEKFSWLVKSGTSATNFTLTDRTATLIAQTISLNGNVKVSGDMVVDGSITTEKLATNAIKSKNYTYSSGNYSTAGTYLDLSNGLFRSKNFAIDSSGNAYMAGTVKANSFYLYGNELKVDTASYQLSGCEVLDDGTVGYSFLEYHQEYAANREGTSSNPNGVLFIDSVLATKMNGDLYGISNFECSTAWITTGRINNLTSFAVTANAFKTGNHSVSWLKAFQGNTALYVGEAGSNDGFNSLATIKTQNGAYTLGTLNSNSAFYIAYGTEDVVTGTTNTITQKWVFDSNGSFLCKGEIQCDAQNQFRAVNGNYGVIFRNDGSSFYILLTNSGDPYGAWRGVYPFRIVNSTGAVLVNGTTVTSDERDKAIIGKPDERYESLFMSLNPILYRWTNGFGDGKMKLGFGAQTVEQKITDAGLTADEFGVVSHDDFPETPFENGRTDQYSLDYQSISMLMVPVLQKTVTRVTECKTHLYSHDLQLHQAFERIDGTETRMEALQDQLNDALIRIAEQAAEIAQLRVMLQASA